MWSGPRMLLTLINLIKKGVSKELAKNKERQKSYHTHSVAWLFRID
jgi:hypothetical protein